MTISSTISRKSYVGNDVTVNFSFPYYFFEDGDLIVVLVDDATGVETVQTITTHYTIAGEGDPAGGTVTMVTAPATGETLVIYRFLDMTQEVDYLTGDAFPAETHEQALDRLTMLAQQIHEEVGRSIRVSIASDLTDIEVPEPVSGYTIIGNSTNDGFEQGPSATEVSNAQTYATNALASQAASAASAAAALLSELAAAASAATIPTYNSLTGEALNFVRLNAGETTMEFLTPTEVKIDLGLVIGTDVQAHNANIPTVPASQAEMEAGTETAFRSMSPIRVKQAIDALGGDSAYGLFSKTDPSIPAFEKTAAFTISSSQAFYVNVNGVTKTIAASTVVTMPSATTGTDYAIWAHPDGTLEATANFTSPPVTGARKIGGFHYAPGGNATGTSGGDTTPSINEYSIWDLNFRPTCPDPRGMALVADGFWADIYLLGVDHYTNGTSAYNVSIADGSSPPKIPAEFGGNGTTAYGSLTWWEAEEVMRSHGKRLPSYDEFAALAYGTTEATSSGGTDVPTTGVTGTGATSAWNVFTSKWGAIQASGCMYSWGANFGGGSGTAAWTANTGGRGSTYQLENAALFGGPWGNGADSGSRCSLWNNSPSVSFNNIGGRGVCDHYRGDE